MQHPTMYTVFREFVIGSHSFKLLEIFAKISFSFFFLVNFFCTFATGNFLIPRARLME